MFDWITDIPNILSGGLWAFIVMGIGLFFGSIWKKRAQEFRDIVDAIKEARSKDSAGGEQVTAEEWRNIAEQLWEFVLTLLPKYFTAKVKAQSRLTRGSR